MLLGAVMAGRQGSGGDGPRAAAAIAFDRRLGQADAAQAEADRLGSNGLDRSLIRDHLARWQAAMGDLAGDMAGEPEGVPGIHAGTAKIAGLASRGEAGLEDRKTPSAHLG